MGVIDEAFKVAGQKKGVEIWRIKDFKVIPLEKEQYGTFYSGDSYIVLHTKENREWDVHFWLGKNTTQDEMGTAAIKTVELDDALGGGPVQYREVQDHESPTFMSYFKNGIKYMEGGFESGFRHVEDQYATWKPRLFHCKGKRNVRCSQVEVKRENLNLGDVFILDMGLDIYVWCPPQSGRLERIKGMEQAKSIRDNERAGRPVIHVLDNLNWDTKRQFWEPFGGYVEGCVKKATSDKKYEERYARMEKPNITLWKVSDASGKMVVSKIASDNLKTDMLDSKDAFILDAVKGGIYVWVGKLCTMEERKKAMVWAGRYMEQQNRPKYTQVLRVLEGAESGSFMQWFTSWNAQKAREKFQLKLFQCSDESGRLVVEEIGDFTQEDLDGDDVMVLDTGAKIYVWVGSDANKGEKEHALDTAKKYLETDAVPRPQQAEIETVFQGEESPTFKKYFPKWDDKLFKDQQRSAENMRKLLFS